MTFLDISQLERGHHNLSMDFNLEEMKEKAAEIVLGYGYDEDRYLTNIYFIYDPQ